MTLLNTHFATAIFKVGARYCCQGFNIELPAHCKTPFARAATEIKIQLSARSGNYKFDRVCSLHKILPNGQTIKV